VVKKEVRVYGGLKQYAVYVQLLAFGIESLPGT